jgi:hypothetical protein
MRMRQLTASLEASCGEALSSLNGAETRDLQRCEAIITKGWDAFVEVGEALAHIRDNRLYRSRFHSFDSYCRFIWQYRKAHAYRLIAAAETMQVLSPIGDIALPRNEAQVRPLRGLPADAVRIVWRKVLLRAGSKPVTATLVKQAVAEFKAGLPKGDPGTLPDIPQQVIDAVRQADKLMPRIKRSIKAGDLRKTMILIYELRHELDLSRRDVKH